MTWLFIPSLSLTLCTMKIEPVEFNKDPAAMEKPSFASRLLVVLIKLHFVPVKLDKIGKATFTFLGFRHVLSFVCWYLPVICFYAVFLYAVMLAPIFQYNTFGIPVMTFTAIAMVSFLMLLALSLSYCLGYLVGHSELLIPTEIASTNLLKLILIWVIGTANLFLPEILGAEARGIIFCNKIFSSMVILEQQICLGILKIIANSFKKKCEQLKTSENLIHASTRNLDLYKSIKKGSGPIFFILYSYGTISIIINLYQLIAGIIPFTENAMGMLAILLMVYELSAYGHELNADICSSAALVR